MENPSAPAGKSLRYARRELERRFLLERLPGEPAVRVAAITDHYLTGTRLRVRSTTERDATGVRTYYKLTQKVPTATGSPGLITTVYIDAAEHALLSSLPALTLAKTRTASRPSASMCSARHSTGWCSRSSRRAPTRSWLQRPSRPGRCER